MSTLCNPLLFLQAVVVEAHTYANQPHTRHLVCCESPRFV